MSAISNCLDAEYLQKSSRVSSLYLRLRNEMHGRKEEWQGDHSVLTEQNRDKPLIYRQALAFEEVMTEMPIGIKDGELVVGIVRLSSVGTGGLFPDYSTEEEKAWAAKRHLSPFSVWGHYVPDYPEALRVGIKGIRAKAAQKLKGLQRNAQAPAEKAAFYEAVILSCDAAVGLAHRYARLARSLAEREQDPERNAELLEIAAICHWVPENPPRGFHEAVQFFWFLHLIFHSTLNLIPIGRIDQYLFPFLERDLAAGGMSLLRAQELIDCLWLKFNERYQERDLVQDFLDPYAFHLGGMAVVLDKSVLHQNFLQNVILGGQKEDGSDASNPLTYLCLNATQKFELTNPTVTVRQFRGSPPELLRKACQVIRQGGGQPTLYNDEVLVPAIRKLGIPTADARGYTNDGCWETLIPGKTEFRYYLVNAAQVMELALNRGINRLTGAREGCESPDPLAFQAFADVFEAFQLQLACQLKKLMDIVVSNYGNLYRIAPVPFLSSLIEPCLEQGLDVTQGGARYIMHAMILMGFSHAVDSLVALKKLVFEDRVATMDEIVAALQGNFEGGEDLRQALRTRSPKYGNNDEYADSIGRQVLALFNREIKDIARGYAGNRILFPTGAGSFEFYMLGGSFLGALPDGRRSREPLSTNLSPSLGVALEGVTSAINSFTGLGLQDLATGSPLDLSVDRKFLAGEEGLERLIALAQTFLGKGGNMLNISVNSVEELRQAQREPEKYRHLRVRMGGWQAYFVDLTREHQDHHIARLELYA